jgi:hypothetical protein
MRTTSCRCNEIGGRAVQRGEDLGFQARAQKLICFDTQIVPSEGGQALQAASG